MSFLRFHEVVVMDDFFRSSDNGLQSHPANRRFLYSFFELAFRRLGIAMRAEYAESSGGAIPVASLMDLMDLPRTKDGWAAALSRDLVQSMARLKLLPFGGRTLVIGWGMPPSLLRYIDARGASFLDVEVDQIRFTQHLYLCIRTNHQHLRRVLEELRIEEEIVWNAAAGLKGFFSRRGEDSVFHPDLRVGLFVGQTVIDIALVCGGHIAKPADFIETVSAWAKEVDVFAVKPHPYEKDGSLLASLIDQIPNAVAVDHNIYALSMRCCMQRICNSSVACRRASSRRPATSGAKAASSSTTTAIPWSNCLQVARIGLPSMLPLLPMAS